MGTYIKPCHGCPLRHDCELRDEWRQRLQGIGLRSATFNCPRLTAQLRVGRRVKINTVTGVHYDRYGESHAKRQDVTATITGVQDTKFSCVVDPDYISLDPDDHAEDLRNIDRIRFRKTAPHTRIKAFLDEPDLATCRLGQVQRDGKCESPWCERKEMRVCSL